MSEIRESVQRISNEERQCNRLYSNTWQSIFGGALLYILFFVRKMWGMLSSDEKREEVNYIKELILSERLENLSSWIDYGRAERFLLRFFDIVIKSKEFERSNLIMFIEESYFLDNLCAHFDYKKREPFDDNRIEKLINSFDFSEYRIASIIYCNIYYFCSRKMQLVMSEIINDNVQHIPFKVVIRGIFTGAIKYDEKIQKMIMGKLSEGSYGDFLCFDTSNPVYTLSLLFLWGYIDSFELEKYKEYCDRSIELTYLICHDSKILEYLDENWKDFFFKSKL